MNKVKIKHENKTYFVSPVEDNPSKSSGDTTDNFMFLTEDENEKIVGCITFTWARTARSVTPGLVFNNNREEEIAYLALIPHLPFYPELANKLYSTCFRYIFNTVTDGIEADKTGYNIKVQGGFTQTKQKIIFGGQPSDDQVRRLILTTLNNHRIERPGEYLHLNILSLFVPVDKKCLTRN